MSSNTADGSLYRPRFPASWTNAPLYSLARWVNGLAFRNIHFSDAGDPVIKIGEIKNGISKQTKFTSQVFDESVRVMPGDMLFAWSGQPETSIDVHRWDGPAGWLNQHVFRVIPDRAVSGAFFYYLLRYLRPNFVRIARNKQTTGLGHVTKHDLQSLLVAYPSLTEQRAIASTLGVLDDKIVVNRKLSATLEATARALFKSWFVDFDPVRAKSEGREPGLPPEIAALFPDSFEDSELGKVPKGWTSSRVADLADVFGGGTPSTNDPAYWDGPFSWVTPKDLSGLSFPVLLSTQRTITSAGLAKISSGLLPAGTLLLSSRAPIGYLAITEIPVAINQGFIAIRPRPGVSNLFLLRWAEWAHDEIVARANGSTFLEISKSNFRPIPITRPSEAVMMLFEKSVRPLHDRVVLAERESRVLAALRDSLLPKLISGEIGVSAAKRLVEQAV